MLLKRSAPQIALIALVGCIATPRAVEAGPLLDWLFGRTHTAQAYPVGPPVAVGNGAVGNSAVGAPQVAPYNAGYGLGYSPYAAQPTTPYAQPNPNALPGYAGNYGNYYSTQMPAIGPAGAGYTAPMPSGIAAATLPAQIPATLSYVPNFQTQAQRTPVTYYRPLMTTNPNTGAQVIAMAPCTSYEYMAQRVPALGRSALYGSNTAPVFQPPAQALPTYTLPSGGIPLSYSAPSITAPYSTGYGAYGTNPGFGYSALQPAVAQPPLGAYPAGVMPMAPTSVGPAGAYPTAPLGTTPYYGSTSGGSCGAMHAPSALQTVPGLVAPQAPNSNYPPSGYPQSGYPAPGSSPYQNNQILPGDYPAPSGNAPSGVMPPSGAGSADPADIPPQLPSFPSSAANERSSNLRPQLRSVVRMPRAEDTFTTSNSPRSDSSRSDADNGPPSRSAGQVPAMLPIPTPENFQHQPRWNPGLLREEDMTALRPIGPAAAQMAGQSKPIQWASFESAPAASERVDISPLASRLGESSDGLRPIRSTLTPVSPTIAAPRAPRETGGWKVAR